MKAIRIDKEGAYMHHFCKKCNGDTIHIIQVAHYQLNKVVYIYGCMECFDKWDEIEKHNKKRKFIIEHGDFEGVVGEMANEKWNEFVEFSKLREDE